MAIILPAVVSAVSCSDFLDRAPGDNMTEQELFSKIETAEAFLDNVYTYLPDFQYNTEDLSGRYKLGDATDEGGFQQASGYTQCPFDINLGSWNSETMPMQRNWSDYYGCIRRCNMLIKNYDLIPEEMTTGAATNRKERILGEAYGLRGYYYFLLFKQWGGVPIITSVLDPGDESQLSGIKRASAEETLQRVLDDMDEAIKHLPAKHNDANFGRFTSLVATVVKSQVKLYWASRYWNRDNDMDRWSDAVDACREAYNMALQNGHVLARTYSSLFNESGIQNEVIWTKNSPYYYECYWWDWYAMPLGYGAFNVDGPLQELVDDFEMKESGEIPVLGYTSDNQPILNEKAYDYVVEATGSISGFETSLALTKPRGTLILKSTIAASKEFNLAPVVVDEITIVGSRCGQFAPAMRMLESKSIDVTPLISDVYPIEKSIEAFERNKQRNCTGRSNKNCQRFGDFSRICFTLVFWPIKTQRRELKKNGQNNNRK